MSDLPIDIWSEILSYPITLHDFLNFIRVSKNIRKIGLSNVRCLAGNSANYNINISSKLVLLLTKIQLISSTYIINFESIEDLCDIASRNTLQQGIFDLTALVNNKTGFISLVTTYLTHYQELSSCHQLTFLTFRWEKILTQITISDKTLSYFDDSEVHYCRNIIDFGLLCSTLSTKVAITTYNGPFVGKIAEILGKIPSLTHINIIYRDAIILRPLISLLPQLIHITIKFVAERISLVQRIQALALYYDNIIDEFVNLINTKGQDCYPRLRKFIPIPAYFASSGRIPLLFPNLVELDLTPTSTGLYIKGDECIQRLSKYEKINLHLFDVDSLGDNTIREIIPSPLRPILAIIRDR